MLPLKHQWDSYQTPKWVCIVIHSQYPHNMQIAPQRDKAYKNVQKRDCVRWRQKSFLTESCCQIVSLHHYTLWGRKGRVLPSHSKLSKVDTLRRRHFATHILKLGCTEDSCLGKLEVYMEQDWIFEDWFIALIEESGECLLPLQLLWTRVCWATDV